MSDNFRTVTSDGYQKRFTGLTANQQALLTNYVQHWDDSIDSSGLHVNIHSGMRLDTVYTAVKRIADSVASTPCPAYQYLDRGKEKAKTHPVYRVLNVQSNPDMTSFTWKHVSCTHLLGFGNAFSEVERDNAGRVIGLNPMHPDDVRIVGRTPDTRELVYSWRNNEGKMFYFPASDVLHIRGMSFDGIMGISPIMQLRQLVGRAKAREEFQTRFYANGAVLGGVITTQDEMTEEKLKRFRKTFDELYRGPQNSGKILLLEGASKFDGLGVNPRDAQFLETSKLDAARIAAAFGIPLQFLNEVETTTRASAEQLFREFLALGLNTLFCNIEQQINVALFTPKEQESFYVEFLREALIQSDFAALITGLKDQVLTAILTPNEAREMLNKNPLDGGDTLLAPVNLVPIDKLGQTTAFQPTTTEPKPKEPTPTEPKPATEPTQTKSIRAIEPTKKRNKTHRNGIIRSQKILLKDAFDRVGTRERKDIANAVKKNLRDGKSFERYITDYYADDSSFSQYFARTMKPLIDSADHHVRTDVSDQLDTQLDEGTDFADSYLDTMRWRYTNSSQNQLKKLLADLPEGDDPADTLDERLSEWENGTTADNPTRAEKESSNESTRMVNAMARAYFAAGGVQRLVWSGGDCPLCEELDGKVVGIDDSFASEGDEVGSMTVESDTFHPPLHQGCNCEIDPEG